MAIKFNDKRATRLLNRFRQAIYLDQADLTDIVAAATCLIREAANKSAPNIAERNMFIEEVVSTLREQR